LTTLGYTPAAQVGRSLLYLASRCFDKQPVAASHGDAAKITVPGEAASGPQNRPI